MFVQIVQGKVTDAAGFRKQFDSWIDEVGPKSIGALGSTAGTTADGRFFVIARFEDEAKARANSDLPEQSAWWAEMEKYVTDVTFEESTDVELMGSGGSDDAGFVQVMKYKVTDEAKGREIWESFDQSKMAEFRPDIIGGVMVGLGDGRRIDVSYFTSEAAAREGEKKETPPEMAEAMEGWSAIMDGEMEFIDLPEPMLRTVK